MMKEIHVGEQEAPLPCPQSVSDRASGQASRESLVPVEDIVLGRNQSGQDADGFAATRHARRLHIEARPRARRE